MDERPETRIYLVRHAEPLMPHVDGKRPLSERGRKEMEVVAREVAAIIGRPPVKIVHSGKLRALQTADILGRELDPAGGVEEGVGLLPGDDVLPWLEGLASVDEDLMLVGHMPFMADLRHMMTGGRFAVMRTGEVVCVESSDGRWIERWCLSPGDFVI